MLTPRTQYIGSELTRKGMCEQARHVMLPQEYMRVEYDVTMKTGTNQPLQKYRCLYKAFKWSKHSQKRKLWVFLQYKAEKCTTLMRVLRSSCSYFMLRSRHFTFSFHSKSMSVCVRLTCRTECTYCLVYFCAAFSRVLRN